MFQDFPKNSNPSRWYWILVKLRNDQKVTTTLEFIVARETTLYYRFTKPATSNTSLENTCTHNNQLEGRQMFFQQKFSDAQISNRV